MKLKIGVEVLKSVSGKTVNFDNYSKQIRLKGLKGMKNYKFPRSFPKADEIELFVNQEKVEVLKTNVAYFACVAYVGKISVEIKANNKITDISISPLNLFIKSEIKNNVAYFELNNNLNLYINVNGVSLPLFFYGNSIIEANEHATYYFRGGQIYEVGEIILKDDESIFIEGGAIVKGCISAKNSDNIKIYGQGVLDGSYFVSERGNRRTILLDNCTNVEIKDIILIQPPAWMIMLAGCKKVHIDNVKEIGEVIGSDGVDVVGCTEILIENCIFKNNDDCVVIKASEGAILEGGLSHGWNKIAHDIEVRGCIFINDKGGNAIEIGHELQIDEVSKIKFSDIDIVCVNGLGAAFSIHVGDRATVRDIVFENIRVQHYYDKLVDFRIMCSQFNKDKERGQLRNVLLKDIYVTVSEFNPGYSISTIGGYDEKHTVEDITFENFYLGDKKVLNANQLDLFTKNTKNIIFK